MKKSFLAKYKGILSFLFASGMISASIITNTKSVVDFMMGVTQDRNQALLSLLASGIGCFVFGGVLSFAVTVVVKEGKIERINAKHNFEIDRLKNRYPLKKT